MTEGIAFMVGKDPVPVSAANPLPTTGGGGGGAVTVANGADVTQGAIADAAYVGSGSATVIAALKGLYAKVAGTLVFSKATLTATNKSGTITTGGTAQPAIAANAARKGWTLGNVSAACTVTDDGSTPSATNGIPINSAQVVDDGGNVSGLAIQVWCATTGATFYATEYT